MGSSSSTSGWFKHLLSATVVLAFILATFIPMEYVHGKSSSTVDLRGTWEFSFNCSNTHSYDGTLVIDNKQSDNTYTGNFHIRRVDTNRSAEENAVITINVNSVTIRGTVYSTDAENGWSNDDFDLNLKGNVMTGNLKSTHNSGKTDTGSPTFKRVSKGDNAQ